MQIRFSDAVPGSRHEPGAEYLGVRMHREDEANADDKGEGRVVEVVATFKVARLGSWPNRTFTRPGAGLNPRRS